MKLKQLTDSKDRHWVVQLNKDQDIIMKIRHKRTDLMVFPIPKEFIKPLEDLGIIKIEK